MKHDDLGMRMKNFYEQIPKTRLMRRCPVIIRIDGKAFHTFTKGFKRPFDNVLIKSMQETMKYLCKNIQGCVLSYHQSDEISLVLIDYQKLTSDAWFDYEVQKMCSITASMATIAFNKIFSTNVLQNTDWFSDELLEDGSFNENYKNDDLKEIWICQKHAADKGAMFDARCFNIPKEEVTNYIYWRQLYATRNSIQIVGQANFSHKELQGKSCNQIQDMLMAQKKINWNDVPIYQKRGSCAIKIKQEEKENMRNEWIVDTEIPIFKGEDRYYIDRLVYCNE